ncbi:MAG: S8 family serine peptidase [Planctomycetes bacterium]|nr:S8 family serine peptidase [Planctomycetota bacterium]
MFWSKLWPWRRAPKAPVRRRPTTARLAVECLEDRLVPAVVGPIDPVHEAWSQQTFRVDDVSVVDSSVQTGDATLASASALSGQNPTFGPLIGLPNVFSNTSYRGAGYSVAVIDTGIDYNNPNLGGGFGPGFRVIAGWDFANNDANPMDDNGHGTHVAGIIGSSNQSYSGVAPDVNLIALKVLGADGSGSYGSVESALQWVVSYRAQYNIVAVNLSLGSGNYTTNPFTFLDDEFTSLKNGGVFISVAAGNSFYSNSSAIGMSYPAVSPLVASVGAVYSGDFGAVAWGSGARDNTTAADRVASFSQRGPALSIMAPGAIITSTYLNNTFRGMAGTSMATPVVAGSAVLIHQAMDSLGMAANQDTILNVMKTTGVSIVDGDDEDDNVANTGRTYKRLDLYAALNSLGTPTNSAPVLQDIAAQNVAPGGTLTLTLNATDANGDAITFSARVLGGSSSQAYQLQQQLGLTFAGDYFQNSWGENEKWMTSTSGTWYCILPNGEVRRWEGSMATTMSPANLVATLDASFYADPSLLWNAQPGSGAIPTVSIAGNRLTIQAPADGSGSVQVEVTASDGQLSSVKTFGLTIQGNAAPQIGAISDQTMFAGRSLTVSLNSADANGDAITYTATLVGSFATPPATLLVVGDQLTIHAAPDFAGRLSIQVAGSDGSLQTFTTFQVTITAAPGVKRFSGDFNGDGRQDVALFNTGGAWWVSLANADGTFVNQKWAVWAPATSWRSIQVGDFNADGKTDVVGFSTGGVWRVGLSTGDSFVNISFARWSNASVWSSLQVGDFDGDGKTDVSGFSVYGGWWVGLSTGTGFSTRLWSQWSASTNWSTIQVGDVNGDGKTDVLGFSLGGQWRVGVSTGESFTIQPWARWAAASTWRTVRVGDFNGDGLIDVLGFNKDGSVQVGLSNGIQFDTSSWAQWSAARNWSTLQVADIDGNGLVDFLGRNKDGNWYVAYSTGDRFDTQLWSAATPPLGAGVK